MIELERYADAWEPDDPHASFKADVAERTRLDPLPTLEGLAAETGVSVGALASYALVRWASEGSDALLALGPRAIERLCRVVEEAERVGTDAARLAAYEQLRGQLSWLRTGLE